MAEIGIQQQFRGYFNGEYNYVEGDGKDGGHADCPICGEGTLTINDRDGGSGFWTCSNCPTSGYPFRQEADPDNH